MAPWPSQRTKIQRWQQSLVTAFCADSWDPCCRTVIGFVSIARLWCRQKCCPRNSRSKRKATDRRRLWDAATPPDTLSLFTERGDVTAVAAKRLPTPFFYSLHRWVSELTTETWRSVQRLERRRRIVFVDWVQRIFGIVFIDRIEGIVGISL